MRKVLFTLCFLSLAMWIFGACTPPSDPCTLPEAPECGANGSCVDNGGVAECVCEAGYEGDNCETNIDDCASEPCENDGICTDGVNEFTCDCALGYSGLTCDSVDFMKVFVTASSYNGAVGGVAGADAICQDEADAAGLVGEFYAWLSVDADDSPSARFSHSDLPYVLPDETQVASNWDDLIDYYYGNDLDAPIGVSAWGGSIGNNNVWTNTLPDGNVMELGDAWNCSGFSDADAGEKAYFGSTGSTYQSWTTDMMTTLSCSAFAHLYCFQQDDDICNPNPCLNGGTCEDNGGVAECDCEAGYDGALCENDIDDCASEPCENDGICTDGIDSYSCECVGNYTGTNCETEQGICGDGTQDTGEACDDGGESAACDADCTLVECGDGELNATAGEACDDGNLTEGDGCSSTCEINECLNDGQCPTGVCNNFGNCTECLQGSHCDDGNLCTNDSCNVVTLNGESTGTCQNQTFTCTPDSNLCTTEYCVPTQGCVSTVPTACPGGVCNPSSGSCVECLSHANCPDNQDNLFCTNQECDPNTNECGGVAACAWGETCNESIDQCI